MSSIISITPQQVRKLNQIPLTQLSLVVQSGILQTKINQLFLPALKSQIFMYLTGQQQVQTNSVINDQQVVAVVDRIITEQSSFAELGNNNQQLSESLWFVDKEIIDVVYGLYPFIFKRYIIECRTFQKYNLRLKQTVIEGKVMVDSKNIFGVGNILKLCLANLNKAKELKLTKSQIVQTISNFVFPIYLQFSSNQLQQFAKPISQTIKKLIFIYKDQQLQTTLSELFVSFYSLFWTNSIIDNCNIKHVALVESHLLLLQLIHFDIPYHHQLLSSPILLSHIKSFLQFKGQNRGSIHLLVVNIFQKLAKQVKLWNQTAQLFINLFNILGCYGSHLIKDVWLSIYPLIQSKQSSIFSKMELIDILLIKLQNHQNSNVIKNCLHELLQNTNSNQIFQSAPSMIYNSLIRMLNLGVHYQDCMFHMDSKVYPLIVNFFIKFYNDPSISIQLLSQHLGWFLNAILSKTNYDHAFIALLRVFQFQDRVTEVVDLNYLNMIGAAVANGYTRFPIRKRHQMMDSILNLLQNNINTKVITFQHIFHLFSSIHTEYLIRPKQVKLTNILNKFNREDLSQWVNQLSETIIQQIQCNVNCQKQDYELAPLFTKIQMVELYMKLYNQQIQKYQIFMIQLLSEYADSQYKSIKQRYFIVVAYSLVYDNLIRTNTFKFGQQLGAALNSIVMYCSSRHSPTNYDCGKQAIALSYQLFFRTYMCNQGQDNSQREGQRVVAARMLEWAKDKIVTQPLALQIIIEACRARINVLQHKQHNPSLYQNYHNLFEQTLYQIDDQLNSLQSNHPSTTNLAQLSKDKQLRLKVLTTTILINDNTNKLAQSPPTCSQINDFIDRFDFQHYEQLCWMISFIYCRFTIYNGVQSIGKFMQRMKQEQCIDLSRSFQLLLQNMINNLQYSLCKKQIVGICQSAVGTMFTMAAYQHSFSHKIVQFCIKLIKSGQNYLIFQRQVTMLVCQELYNHFDNISHYDCTNFIPLIIQILTIEEYRGYDSAVNLYQQTMADTFYCSFNPQLQTNYYGAVPRFFMMHTFSILIQNRIDLDQTQVGFIWVLIQTSFNIATAEVVKQKMFLSGKNKIKLQMWQFLLTFPPSFFTMYLHPNKLNDLMVRCVELLSHNSIAQIRYYSQMFLMRILMHQNHFNLITAQLLKLLQLGLVSSIGNVGRNVAHMIISGLLIQHITQNGNKFPQHFCIILDSFVALFNSLLTYVCSSVAYFRGISQYFCLQNISPCIETKYVAILRQNYLNDPDAGRLKVKLAVMIQSYVNDIKHWSIHKEVLNKIPNNNNNVISQQYYMDSLKRLGVELAKVVKNQDGFTAYKYIWKKNVDSGDVEEQQQQKEVNIQGQEDETTFQRKIDPTLDFIYNQQTKSHLKIMITSSKSQVLLGHLARTGQIFGIEELIIPCRRVIELDKFKSISVTAERWLNISDLGAELGKQAKPEYIIKTMIRNKSQGYEIIRLCKQPISQPLSSGLNMSNKCLLILDQQNIMTGEMQHLIDRQLQISQYLSLHVQASILIWSYFKLHSNKQLVE